jgi:hypothetical protein
MLPKELVTWGFTITSKKLKGVKEGESLINDHEFVPKTVCTIKPKELAVYMTEQYV